MATIKSLEPGLVFKVDSFSGKSVNKINWDKENALELFHRIEVYSNKTDYLH